MSQPVVHIESEVYACVGGLSVTTLCGIPVSTESFRVTPSRGFALTVPFDFETSTSSFVATLIEIQGKPTCDACVLLYFHLKGKGSSEVQDSDR